MKFIDDNLQKVLWTTNISIPINSVLSTEFIASPLPNGQLKVTNTGRQPYAGGLVYVHRQIPSVGGIFTTPYITTQTRFLIPSYDLFNIARLEFDGIFVMKGWSSGPNIPNKFNNSTQLNFSSKTIQIDASSTNPGWSDVAPLPNLSPDLWYDYIIKSFLDIPNNQILVYSITIGSITNTINKTTGCQSSNWGQVAAIQKQNELFNLGSSNVIYDQTQITWSDSQ